MQKGSEAIAALSEYRELKSEIKGQPTSEQEALLAKKADFLKENMRYFGYGYIRNADEAVPFIPLCFYTFRIMVGLGCLFILFFAVMLAVTYKWPKWLFAKRDITALPKWHYWLAIALIPLAYIASESGWLVAEFGRQPWTIQDLLPTWAAVSDLQSSSVMITFFLFLILFTTMLAVEINILLKQIKKGPEYER
jgi:cytochrome d ubiquinol oxidase subunit I